MRKVVIVKAKWMTIECSVFLDTNAIIHLIAEGKILSYRESKNLCFHTFEKCIYEYKNGLKRYFINIEFLLRCIKNPLKNQSVSWEETQATSIIARVIEYMNLDQVELDKLTDALKAHDLRYEFGMAPEQAWTTTNEMENKFYKYVRKENQYHTGVLRLKQFYKLIHDELNSAFLRLDQRLSDYKLDIILYDQVFGTPRRVLEFRSMMKECYLPTEDLEIIFSAISSKCQLFVTADNKIIKQSLTLGLNHCLEFIHLDELENRLAEWVQTA